MTTCLYGVPECVCANRRHPAALPKNFHRIRKGGLQDLQLERGRRYEIPPRGTLEWVEDE